MTLCAGRSEQEKRTHGDDENVTATGYGARIGRADLSLWQSHVRLAPDGRD